MKHQGNLRYERAIDFFELDGNISMYLTREAAQHVCLQAINHGLLVTRFEGGIWHNPGFEARLDCIWDGLYPPVTVEAARTNNLVASQRISDEPSMHDVFVITTVPLVSRQAKSVG